MYALLTEYVLYKPHIAVQFEHSPSVDVSACPFSCRWILSRLNNTTVNVVKSMHAYDFAAATNTIYAFWQYELCDVFIELCKPAFNKSDADEGAARLKQQTRDTLWICLETGLRLLHPFMPFVTEELWQRLPRRSDEDMTGRSIMIERYPEETPSWDDAAAEKDMGFVINLVSKIRSLRADYGLNKQKPSVYVAAKDDEKRAVVESAGEEIATLTTSASVTVLKEGDEKPHGCGVCIVDDTTTAHMALAGILDAAKEVEKLEKKEVEAAERVESLKNRRLMPDYAGNTPEAVRESDQARWEKYSAELEAIRCAIQDMKALLQ